MIYLHTALNFAFVSVVIYGFCRIVGWTWVRQRHASGVAARRVWLAIRLITLFGALAPMLLVTFLFIDWALELSQDDTYSWFLIASWALSLAPGMIWLLRRRRALEARWFR
jgi:hypothetical protein